MIRLRGFVTYQIEKFFSDRSRGGVRWLNKREGDNEAADVYADEQCGFKAKEDDAFHQRQGPPLLTVQPTFNWRSDRRIHNIHNRGGWTLYTPLPEAKPVI